MGRHKKIVVEKVEFDLSQYDIVEEYPFSANLYRAYYGTLENCIKEFEQKYGKIDGKIYYNGGSLVGITGTQVVPHMERNIK